MTATRTAAYLGGAVLLAGWFASAAGVSRQLPAVRLPAPSPEAVHLDAVALNVQSQAARLRKRLAAAPAPQAPAPQPVRVRRRARPRPQRVAARREPPPAPARKSSCRVEPALDLLGVAEERHDGAHRDASALGDELLMVTVGQRGGGTLPRRRRRAPTPSSCSDLDGPALRVAWP